MYERKTPTSGLAWLSLGISIVALILSLVALILVSSGKDDPLGLFMGSRRSGHEAAIIASLRTLSSTQEQYRSRFGQYATLQNLGDEGYIDPILSSGRKTGYRITIEYAGANQWSCNAVPEQVGVSGDRGFFVDETGVIRYSPDGSEPDSNSMPLD